MWLPAALASLPLCLLLTSECTLPANPHTHHGDTSEELKASQTLPAPNPLTLLLSALPPHTLTAQLPSQQTPPKTNTPNNSSSSSITHQ